MKLIFIIQCTVFFILFSSAQTNYPVPSDSKFRLFFVQHSLSTNTYVYDVNIKNNAILRNDPINVYRILFEDNGQKANLTIPQRKLAYGYTVNTITNDKFDFTLAGYKYQKMKLLKYNNKYVVETRVNDKSMILDRMFVKIKSNTSPLKVEVDYILFTGIDSKSGQKITEKFIMND